MAKKLGKCARCKNPLVPEHWHQMSGSRLCDDCYPYVRDPESGKLMYKEPKKMKLPGGIIIKEGTVTPSVIAPGAPAQAMDPLAMIPDAQLKTTPDKQQT